MLGKRGALVDYSSDEGEPTGQHEANNKLSHIHQEPSTVLLKDKPHSITAVQPSPKPVRTISYSKLLAQNVVKSLLEDEGLSSKIGVDFMSDQKQQERMKSIQFDTVSGKRVLSIDQPREKIWRQDKGTGGMSREPYYYKAMKEIYHDRIVKAEAGQAAEDNTGQGVQITSTLPQDKEEEYMIIEGRRERVKNVTQQELVNFDHAKYMEQKERKDLLLEDKIKTLRRGTNQETNQAKLTTRAMELLEKDAYAEVTGIKEQGIKRNKKQYGF